MSKTTYYDMRACISATVDEYDNIVAIEKMLPDAQNGKAQLPSATIKMTINGTAYPIASDANAGPGMTVGA